MIDAIFLQATSHRSKQYVYQFKNNRLTIENLHMTLTVDLYLTLDLDDFEKIFVFKIFDVPMYDWCKLRSNMFINSGEIEH